MELFRASGLTVSAGARTLVRGLDLTLAAGERAAVVGPSGCGKTTLLRTLALLVDPPAGEVRLEGRTPDDVGYPRYRRQVAFVAQRPVMLDGTVRDNLRFGFGLEVADGGFDEARALEACKQVKLGAEVLEQPAKTLSEGQKQRVALTTGAVTQVVIGVKPWYQPQYVIPLLGMVFGNSLTGISLSLDHLLETLDERRDHIEMALALGATSWEAVREPLREAVRRGMIPIINAMSVAGIVSLPGMMTGQILAGSDPLQAVAYQIVVMFMLAAATSLGCIFTALWVYRRLFSAKEQLLVGHIEPRG